jgi:CheY-like chemotaxis protein
MKHVVVIEDAQPQLKLLAWGLMDVGFRVTVTTDPAAAIEWLRAGEQPDAVVFNISTDGAAKRGAIERIRDLAPEARIIDVADAAEAANDADASLRPAGLSVNAVVEAIEPPEWAR